MTAQMKLSVMVPTSENEVVCVTGNIPQLGNWNPENAVALQKHVPNGVINKYRNGTGGGPPPRQPTELDLRILSMIPQESLSGIIGAVEVSGPNHLVVVADVHHEDTHDVVDKIPGPILNETIIEKSNSPPATSATPAKRKRPISSSTSSDPYITILEQQLLVDKERNEIMKDDLKVRKEIDLWWIIIDLPVNTELQYRFCVTAPLETADGERKYLIKYWETNLNPRSAHIKENKDVQVIGTAMFGEYDGYNYVTQGWLSHQTAIQLRLENNPIHMYKPRHRIQTYSIKCVCKDYRIKHTESNSSGLNSYCDFGDDDSNEGPLNCQLSEVLVSVLRENVCVPCKQKQFGEIYKENDYMVFKSETLFPESLGFQIEFYVHDNCDDKNAPRYIGCSHMLPMDVSHTLGRKRLPILSLKHRPIGEITVNFMIAKPLKDVEFDVEHCFQSHWKHTKPLDVGHRGMGSSYKKLALVRENTVASLCAAAQNGADLVEFDIMLTQDLFPVIYHDFGVQVMSKVRRPSDGQTSSHELLPIPVKDLTLRQLQSMKLSHLSSQLGQLIDINGDVDPEDLQPFPTLQQCFKGVDEGLGFNIEIKYPLQDVEGVWEMTGFMDHNTYIDILLKDVFKGAGSRRIIFSSFDPDSCVLLQRKQNKYPVLFLSNGPTQRYKPYMDVRAQGYDNAMYFALSDGLLGVDLQSEGLLQDLSIIKRVKDSGLILFVWGEDNNDRETIALLRQHGVQGIIYDRIDFYKPEKCKYFEVGKKVLEEMKRVESSDSRK